LGFAAKGGKRQGHAVPVSLRVKPGAKHPVWKTQSRFKITYLKPLLFYNVQRTTDNPQIDKEIF
jgi:hypothetical protein